MFHPLGIAFCKDEKSNDFAFIFTSLNIDIQRCNLDELDSVNLLADAADSITNGFKLAFNYSTCEYKRGMCWFHMRKCVEDKLAMLGDRPLIDLVLQDMIYCNHSFFE